jgi:hypothetical protein
MVAVEPEWSTAEMPLDNSSQFGSPITTNNIKTPKI